MYRWNRLMSNMNEMKIGRPFFNLSAVSSKAIFYTHTNQLNLYKIHFNQTNEKWSGQFRTQSSRFKPRLWNMRYFCRRRRQFFRIFFSGRPHFFTISLFRNGTFQLNQAYVNLPWMMNVFEPPSGHTLDLGPPWPWCSHCLPKTIMDYRTISEQ